MFRKVAGAMGVGLLVTSFGLAQQADEADVPEGRQLYEDHCALCHKESGAGDPPRFPALDGNVELGNLVRVVGRIRQGEGAMPPFPNLTAGAITALVDYVRGAWTNDFGSVSAAEVAAALDGLDGLGPTRSVWEGVFTESQAVRGQSPYDGACALCHGRRLNGAPDDPDMRSTPPLARAPFLRNWNGRSLATLFAYTRATMPENNPDSLTGEEYVDVIAYMLSVSGIPPGDEELGPDPSSLASTVVGPRP